MYEFTSASALFYIYIGETLVHTCPSSAWTEYAIHALSHP